MSSEVAVRAEGLAKSYRLRGSQRGPSYRTLQDEIARLPRMLRRRARLSAADADADRFWALQDVSFEVQEGEVLGIIGRNGAGKSTLLKLLSRITEPTRGRAELYGRVGTLLEIGTGFHPELTGRENISLMGAILGMRKREIAARFDEIVEFAEVERFVDIPVKQYSSGMYMRLAFSVAAHLDPEILIVDEVLAVGDAGFQRKCLGKMGEAARSGRTVLFVSHNLSAVSALCDRAILLSRGRIVGAGGTAEVVQEYVRSYVSGSMDAGGVIYRCPDEARSRPFRIERVELLASSGAPLSALHTWEPVTFRFHYSVDAPVRDLSVILFVRSLEGTQLIRASTAPDSNLFFSVRPGEHRADCVFPRWPLAAGSYALGVALAQTNIESLYLDEDAATLEVLEADVYDSGLAPSVQWASLAPEYHWSVAGAEARS